MTKVIIMLMALACLTGCKSLPLAEEVKQTNAECPITICDGKARIDSLVFYDDGDVRSIFVHIAVDSTSLNLKDEAGILERANHLLTEEVLDATPVVKRLPLDTFLHLTNENGTECDLPFRW